jgi:hypothetical protein
MLTQLITVLCHSNVGGPNGKLFANNLYELQDSEYVRTLIKSGTVSLVDPPSLDPVFLERAGYPLCEGYSYSKGAVVVQDPDNTEPKEEVLGDVENTDNTPTNEAIELTNASEETAVPSTELIEASEPVETAASKKASKESPEETTSE